MKTKQFEFGAVCDIGMLRKVNQDNILIKIGEDKFGEFGLFLVADGVGSMADSQVASEMIVEEFRKWWNERLVQLLNGGLNDTILEEELENLILEIHHKVEENAKRRDLRMGSTLSVLFVYNGYYILKHIGDSRIYLLREDLKLITIDHTYAAEQVRRGFLTLGEAQNHPQKNALTQCVGMKDQLIPYGDNDILKDNDVFLICSDGLYNLVSEAEILEKLEKAKTPQVFVEKIVDEMLKIVMKNGAFDNVSIIVVKYNRNDK